MAYGSECVHSAGTAPSMTVFLAGTPLQTTSHTEAGMIHSTQHRGCRVQDPGTHGYRRWKTAEFPHSARCAPHVWHLLTDEAMALLIVLHSPPVPTPKASHPHLRARAWRGVEGMAAHSKARQ